MRRSAAQPGFTLFEVILATTVAATLAFALYASLSVAIRARRSVEATLGTSREATIVADLIARDLGSIPYPDSGLNNPLSSPFLITDNTISGSGSVIDFRTFAPIDPAAANPRAIIRVELGLFAEAGGYSLIRRVYPNPLATIESAPEEEVLSRGIASFTVRCFDGSTWYDTWSSIDQGDQLPRAVEVTLEFTPADTLLASQATTRITRVIPLACAPL